MSTHRLISVISCAVLLLAITFDCGCAKAPANGVLVRVETSLTDAQVNTIKKRLKRSDTRIRKIGHMRGAGQVSITLSPIPDVQKFADKLRARPHHYGEVMEVRPAERMIFIAIDPVLLK